MKIKKLYGSKYVILIWSFTLLNCIILLLCLGFFVFLSVTMIQKSKTLTNDTDRKTAKNGKHIYRRICSNITHINCNVC